MKKTLLLFMILCLAKTLAQPNTEVFLFDITKDSGVFELNNIRNISKNDGYDNQPSFYDDSILLFASTRKAQTDIARYHIPDNSISWLTDTPGSEYSPLKIPNKKAVSTIRLDKDGTQLLYAYPLNGKEPRVLLQDLKVGYHVWYSKDVIVSAVLVKDGMDLVVSNLKDNSNITFQKNVDRSLHKIPNTNLISYVSKENNNWEIKSLDPISGATEGIVMALAGMRDLCWLNDGTLLAGKGNKLFSFNSDYDKEWNLVKEFDDDNIASITRLAVNASSTLLALVAEASPERIVQQQLEAYNARDIEGFLATYSDDIKLYNHPNTLFAEGKDQLRERYAGFFDATPDLHASIQKRMVIGNKVIDEELVTVNGNQFRAVAIYEVNSGKIVKVTFIQ